MITENLIGKTVTHKTYGVGTITRLERGNVIILFHSQAKEKKFVYPLCPKYFLPLIKSDTSSSQSDIEKHEGEGKARLEKEREMLQTLLVQNYNSGYGVLQKEQLGADMYYHWLELVNNLYVEALTAWEKWEREESLKNTAVLNDLYELIRAILDTIGKVNGYRLYADGRVAKIFACYTTLQEKHVSSFDLFRSKVESYLARIIIVQMGKSSKMLEEEQFDIRLTRRRRTTLKKGQKKRDNSSEIESNEEIEFGDFVVRTYALKCFSGHEIEQVRARVKVVRSNGSIEDVLLNAAFCKTCKCYFILETDYQRAKEKGALLCQQITEEYYRKNGLSIADSTRLESESLLFQSGYSVSVNENLSEKQRQAILRNVIDNGLYTVSGICSHLDWLIARNQRVKSRDMSLAIRKWEEDRKYISTYKTEAEKPIDVKTITRKIPVKW